jgi:hypothetical protein
MALLIAGCDGETVQSSYDTYALFDGSKSQSGGWVPPWLPKSATNIVEKHNLDTNARMWSASVPVGVEVSLPASCVPAKRSELSAVPYEAIWWPESVQAAASNIDQRFFYFRCGPENVGLAREGGQLIGWADK